MRTTTTPVAIWRNAKTPEVLHIGAGVDRATLLVENPSQAEHAIGDAVPLAILGSYRDDESILPTLVGDIRWVSAALLLRIPDAPTLRTVAEAWHAFDAVPDSSLDDDMACAGYAAEELGLFADDGDILDRPITLADAVRVITWLAAV